MELFSKHDKKGQKKILDKQKAEKGGKKTAKKKSNKIIKAMEGRNFNVLKSKKMMDLSSEPGGKKKKKVLDKVKAVKGKKQKAKKQSTKKMNLMKALKA